MKYLITGGCGFLGSNLSREVLKRNEELFIIDNMVRLGSKDNMEWLKSLGNFQFYKYDIRNFTEIENVIKIIKPNFVFHLAGQVAMTTSIENPIYDFEVNALGTINILESIRKYSPKSVLIYSSTNKVYGDLEWVKFTENETRYIAIDYPEGFPETIPLNFCSPYGCSKGSADQYILDYYKLFGVKTVVFRHSSMYGGRQYATYDQGWVGWFCKVAIEQKKDSKKIFTISGNGKQVRDLLHSDDLVNLYFKTVENINKLKGKVYNIGGGPENSMSIIELLHFLGKELNIELKFNKIQPRYGDQKVFIANISKIKDDIGWKPKISKDDGIRMMIEWIKEIHG